ncbi:hypothetical protein [Actinomadura gamaensis]|uniref:Integral membrane protein n=1 Tax=Actinomadura gamaensis TaxID=1763541 RepID=A0ABV9U2S6_9ACTN
MVTPADRFAAADAVTAGDRDTAGDRVTAADRPRRAAAVRAGDGRGTGAAGWTLRAVVSAHVVAIAGQPVFAGVYLSGSYAGLRLHELGANIVTSVGYVQFAVAIVVWARLRLAWPFAGTAALVAAETVQYFAGMAGALWLHLPLGVMTIVALVVQFIAVWFRPLGRRAPSVRERVATAGAAREQDDDE